MTKAILISNGGDPLLGSFCISLLKKNCWDEVDRIYVHYNNNTNTPTEVQAEYLETLLSDPKIRVIYSPVGVGYGRPITEMVSICQEDLILLLEDDGFILQPGAITSAFAQIENGHVDALGSPRFSCGTEIAEALKLKYQLDYSGYGDKGPNFWPNFFFCKRSDLLRTDMNFGPYTFEPGKYYVELFDTLKTPQANDTFVWACIQLRHLGVRFGEIPQHHSSPYDLDEKERAEGKWAVKPTLPWIHGGSLSTGAGTYLAGVVPDMSAEINKFEMESRAAWWTIVSANALGNQFCLSYAEQYRQGILDLMNGALLDRDRVNKKIELYSSLTDKI